MSDVWADPKSWAAIFGGVVGVGGFTWGILSFYWNRRESRLEALSKVLQPMIRAAQLLRDANLTRQKIEYLKHSFPASDERAAEARTRIGTMMKDYDTALKEGTEQFRLTEAENEARVFRFPDKIARLVHDAVRSLSEYGVLVNDGKFGAAEMQFAKFQDDYAEVKREGRGIRLASPFEGLRRRFRREQPTPSLSKFDLSEKEMKGIMDLIYRRATTQAQNTFAVHPPKKLLDSPEIARSDKVVDELEKSVFVVVFQDGTHKMLTLLELIVFLYLLCDLAVQVQRVSRMAHAAELPPSKITTSLRFAPSELMRPEMVKLLLGKVQFSNTASDTLAGQVDRGAPSPAATS